MKNECNIIRDILPLYAESMVSPDTAAFVHEHLKGCEACARALEQHRQPQAIHAAQEAAPLLHLKRKLFAKKVQTIIFTALLVSALLVSSFAFLDAPEYFPYSPELVALQENADGSVTITFDERVTGFRCRLYPEPVEPGAHAASVTTVYHIEAWTSTWERWFSERSPISTTLRPEDAQPYSVYYSSNNTQDSVCLYGEDVMMNGGGALLPRLSLAYYLLFAALAFAALLVLRFALRKKEKIRIWLDRALLYPVSYAIAHFCILGFRTISYSLLRDFFLIVAVSVLLYCGALLAFNLYTLRREQKRINAEH